MPKEFTLDFRDFLKKFQGITKKIVPERLTKGMGQAGLQWMADGAMLPPTVPIAEGTLRGSGSVFVQNRLVGTSKRSKDGTPCTNYSESIPRGMVVAVVGFNTPYAARHHEVPAKFKEPSAGNKYLSSKGQTRKLLYFKIIADAVRSGR